MISTAGPLFFIGLALFSTGLYRACTGARLFAVGEDWLHVALGAAMVGAGVVMIMRGVG